MHLIGNSSNNYYLCVRTFNTINSFIITILLFRKLTSKPDKLSVRYVTKFYISCNGGNDGKSSKKFFK